MAFSINTNISAMTANLYSYLNNGATNNSLNKLSSGSMITSAGSDAAGLAISNQLSAQVSGMGQAIMNSNDSIGMIQVADGAMSGIEENMQRIRTLTLQASNDILSDGDRAVIQKEIDALLQSSDDIANQTQYNGIQLLNGTGGANGNGQFITQSGANSGETQSVSIGDAQVASLVGAIDVTTAAGRASALDSVDGALTSIADIQSDLGAAQNQLLSNIRNTYVSQVNTASAQSQMRDLDFALESANFSKNNLMSQMDVLVQAQANASSANIARLLQF